MAFYKKTYSYSRHVYYPQAIVQGKPVETETVAKELARISTVSNSDVQAVLGDIAPVLYRFMAQGKSVHIKGLGHFRFVLDSVGVTDPTEFDFHRQVKAVRVQFTPEREKSPSGSGYTRALVDTDDIEWICLGEASESSEGDNRPGGGGSSDGDELGG